MANWVKNNWRWALLNLAAGLIMVNILRQAGNVGRLTAEFEPLVESGKWALRFLLVSLAVTPLNSLFGWRSLIKLRKPAGLWAFGFGAAHFVLYVIDMGEQWLQYPVPDYFAALGVAGLMILALMATTSTRWAMKRMGRWWKRLHRTVYVGGILLVLHGYWEASSSKRVLVYDPAAAGETLLYAVVLILLLAARIPVLRSRLVALRHARGLRIARS